MFLTGWGWGHYSWNRGRRWEEILNLCCPRKTNGLSSRCSSGSHLGNIWRITLHLLRLQQKDLPDDSIATQMSFGEFQISLGSPERDDPFGHVISATTEWQMVQKNKIKTKKPKPRLEYSWRVLHMCINISTICETISLRYQISEKDWISFLEMPRTAEVINNIL